MKTDILKKIKRLGFAVLPFFALILIVLAFQLSSKSGEARVGYNCPPLGNNNPEFCERKCTIVVSSPTPPVMPGYTCTALLGGGAYSCVTTVNGLGTCPTGTMPGELNCLLPRPGITVPAPENYRCEDIAGVRHCRVLYTQAERDLVCNGPMGGSRADRDGGPTPCIIERCVNSNCDVAGPDTTSTGCTAEPRCGDGILDSGETCDGSAGSCGTGLGCVGCACVPKCGDGIVAGGEVCDFNPDGSLAAGSTCPAGNGCDRNCKCTPPPARCGDHVINQASETCEMRADGSVELASTCVAGSTCNACTCTPPPPPVAVCGNNLVEGGESCDGSNLGICTAPGATCSPQCKCVIPTCGDGTVNSAAEECDGSNAACETLMGPGATCSASCQCSSPPKPICGDGRIEGTEACEGNQTKACPTTGSTCLNCQCVPPNTSQGPICGDGKVNQDSETCDRLATYTDLRNPAFNLLDICRENCTYCGDGIKNGSEECDPRASSAGLSNTTFCDNDCKIKPKTVIEQAPVPPFCGDNSLSANESCDVVNGTAIGCTGDAECSQCNCIYTFLEGSGMKCSFDPAAPSHLSMGTLLSAAILAFSSLVFLAMRRKSLRRK